MIHSNQKSVATPLCRLGGLVLLIGALGVGTAGAGVQLAPGGAIIFLSSESKAGATTDTKTASAPGFATWTGVVNSLAEDVQNGIYASGQKTLNTSFTPENFAVSSNGDGTATGGGTVSGGSLVAVFFFVDTVQIYNANSYMLNGTFASNRLMSFVANMNNGETPVIPLILGPGFTSVSGRLPPGSYMFYMQNSFGPESDDGDETTFSTGVGFINCTNPLINRQPTNQTVHTTYIASFSVGTSGPAPNGKPGTSAQSAMTFQWRKGLQNLSDGGRISGTHTSQLTIANAAVSDSGLYDCVVTQDAIVEPSSLVHLTIVTGTADVPAIGALTGLQMAVPSPCPFGERTQVRFSLPRSAETGLDVLDVNGRRVRRLLTGGLLEAGAHTLTWDGRDESGACSPAGVYFLQLVSGGEQVVQRVVSLGGPR